MTALAQVPIICVNAKCHRELPRGHVFCEYCGTLQPQPDDLGNKRFWKGGEQIKLRRKYWQWCERCKRIRRVKPSQHKKFCYRCGGPLSTIPEKN